MTAMGKIIEMYKPSKPDNYAVFYGLLRDMPGIDKEELKRTIVMEFTDGRTDSLKEMNGEEYRNACAAMRKIVQPLRKRTESDVMLRRARSATLHLMQLSGIDTADWDVINRFCLDKRIAGKKFGELNPEELRRVQIKIRMILKKQE